MKRLKNFSFKSLCVFMSLLMVLLSFPLTVFAQEVATEAEESHDAEPNAEIIELLDQRTADTKYFRLPDGTYYAAQYETDVHYLDENGVWQDIDNTLTADGSEIITPNAKIKFAKKTPGNGTLFALHDGNRKLTFTLNGANKKVEGQITNYQADLDENATELQKMTTLAKLSASVKYEEILSGTDLEYIISGSKIKEYIIVKKASDSYVYTFTMKLNNLTATQNAAGEILIADSSTGDVAYVIPAPIMWDAANVHSDAVALQLQETGNGEYTLTLTADSAWMNAEERVFPITIDPPLYVPSGDYDNVIDLDVSTASPAVNTANSTLLRANGTTDTYWKTVSLPTLPASAYITDATITLRTTSSNTLSGYVGVYDILTNWDSTLTANKVASASNPQGTPDSDFVDYHQIISGERDYTWNITPIAKKWYEGTNYGLVLRVIKEKSYSGTAYFYSNNASAQKPKLCIRYQDMKGLEDYWSFSSQSAGFAGTGAVNHATGNLVFAIPTLTTTDALMPFTPTLVYNSALAGQESVYPNAQTYNGEYYSNAYGWKWNFQETLLGKRYHDTTGAIKTMYVWSDADGTEHYFLQNPTAEGDTTVTYSDEDGLLLTLWMTENNEITITDSAKNVRTFLPYPTAPGNAVSAWYLAAISDKNGNGLTFIFDSYYRVTTIAIRPNELLSIEQLQIRYWNNTPYMVINPTSREAVFLRYVPTDNGDTDCTEPANYLVSVIRAHGDADADWESFYRSDAYFDMFGVYVDAVAHYQYDASGKLTSVENNLSNYELSYTYTGEKINTITEQAGDATGQSILLSYGASSTELRTSGTDDVINTDDDLITVYSFDTCGRIVNTYTTDTQRTNLYGASSGQYVGEENEKAKNSLKTTAQSTISTTNRMLNGGFEGGTGDTFTHWTKSGIVERVTETPNATNNEVSTTVKAGVSAAKMTVDSSTRTSKLMQTVDLTRGYHTLSAYVNTVNAVQAKMYVKITSTENSEFCVSKEISVDPVDASGGYVLVSLEFDADAAVDNASYVITFELVYTASGGDDAVAYVDNVMLSNTVGATDYDMLALGHFENSNGNSPTDYWSYTNDLDDIVTVYEDAMRGDVLKIDDTIRGYQSHVLQRVYNAPESLKAAYRNGSYRPTEPQFYTLSAWAKGTAQSYNSIDDFSIIITVTYYDGTSDGTVGEYDCYVFPFNKGVTNWQYLCAGVMLDAPGNWMINTITLELCYANHPGVGYFDDVSFVEDGDASFYDYNSLGYLKNASNPNDRCWYFYDDNNNLVRTISSNKQIVEYTYDDDMNRMIKEIHKRSTGGYDPRTDSISGQIFNLLQYDYTYNSLGQQSSCMVTDYSDNGGVTEVSAQYNTEAGSHIVGVMTDETNELGFITRYFYDENTGRLMASLLPDGNGVCYTYDAVGNLTHTRTAVYSTLEEDDYQVGTGGNSIHYTYDAAYRISTIQSGLTTYSFTYDAFGNTDEIKAGDRTLAEYVYNANNGKLSELHYGNGDKVKYLYDSLDRVKEILYNSGENGAFETAYEYRYTNGGALHEVIDYRLGETMVYEYDLAGKPICSYIFDTVTHKNLTATKVSYDTESRVSSVVHTLDYTVPVSDLSPWGIASQTMAYSYEYSEQTGLLIKYQYNGASLTGTVSPVYDNLGRTLSKNVLFETAQTTLLQNTLNYQYVSGYFDSYLVSNVQSVVTNASGATVSNATYQYVYDVNGNITQIKDAAGVIQYQYTYDSLGQLIREDNRPMNATYTWTYDDAGNIQYKTTYAFTTGTLGSGSSTINYGYEYDTGWDDRLISYNGLPIRYDEIGNPTKIVTNQYWASSSNWEEYGYELEWEGRQLIGRRFYELYSGCDIWYDEYYDLSFEYNADGIRTSKTVYETEYKYLLNGTQIIGETWTLYGTEYLLLYIYDENGSPMGIKYRTEAYAAGVYDYFFFEKNLQGDIVAIYNAEGEKIGSYVYDAWGNFTVSTVSGNSALENKIVNDYNPFRYRGYYYDKDLGWYYLLSRYYNPQWGRFINADGYISTGTGLLGYNMFAYCNNNPVMNVDPTGDFPWLLLVVTLILTTFTSCAPMPNKASEDTGDPNSIEGTPIDSKSKYCYSDYESAVFAASEHVAKATEKSGNKWEYSAIIFQYNDGNPNYYYNGVTTSGLYNFVDLVIPDDVTLIATIHSHCNDTLGQPFGADGLERWNNTRIDSFIVIPKNVDGGISPRKIYILPRTAADVTKWVTYHVFS